MMEVDFLPRASDHRGRQLHRPGVRPDVPALRQRGDHHRNGSAPDRSAKTKISPRPSWRSCEREGIDVRLNAKCIGFSKRGEEIVGARGLRRRRARKSPDRTCCWRWAAVPTPTISAWKRPASPSTNAATSSSTINCAPTCRASGRWAIATAKAAFTHTSYNDFEIVAANLLDNDPRRVSDRITAYALYIDPPLGRAGMTEAEVRKSGRPALIGKRPMTKVGRAVEKGETQGFMKILVDAETRSRFWAPRSWAPAATRPFTRSWT